MFRHVNTQEVIALRHAGEEFRADGQRNGINDVYDLQGNFTSEWHENAEFVIANRINPMGFVERETTPILKKEWEPALQAGDTLLALHIPSGPGYTPDRLKNSMEMVTHSMTSTFRSYPSKASGAQAGFMIPGCRLSWIMKEAILSSFNDNSIIIRPWKGTVCAL